MKVIVNKGQRVLHDGDLYVEGESFDCTAAQGRRLVDGGSVTATKPDKSDSPPPPPPTK